MKNKGDSHGTERIGGRNPPQAQVGSECFAAGFLPGTPAHLFMNAQAPGPGISETKPETDMNDEKLLRRGLIGSIIAAICCFTPLLVVLVAGAGLSALVGWLDYALFPMLFASLGVVAHALWIRAGRPGACPRNAIVIAVATLSLLLFWLQFRYALRISVGAALGVALYGFWLSRIGTAVHADES